MFEKKILSFQVIPHRQSNYGLQPQVNRLAWLEQRTAALRLISVQASKVCQQSRTHASAHPVSPLLCRHAAVDPVPPDSDQLSRAYPYLSPYPPHSLTRSRPPSRLDLTRPANPAPRRASGRLLTPSSPSQTYSVSTPCSGKNPRLPDGGRLRPKHPPPLGPSQTWL
jgi:hypothetical protein